MSPRENDLNEKLLLQESHESRYSSSSYPTDVIPDLYFPSNDNGVSGLQNRGDRDSPLLPPEGTLRSVGSFGSALNLVPGSGSEIQAGEDNEKRTGAPSADESNKRLAGSWHNHGGLFRQIYSDSNSVHRRSNYGSYGTSVNKVRVDESDGDVLSDGGVQKSTWVAGGSLDESKMTRGLLLDSPIITTLGKKRAANKRADILASVRQKQQPKIQPAGQVWACTCAGEINLAQISSSAKKKPVALDSRTAFVIDSSFSEVMTAFIYTPVMESPSDGFQGLDFNSKSNYNLPGDLRCLLFFAFGVLVGWDLSDNEKRSLLLWAKPFMKDPIARVTTDEMSYVWSEKRTIRQDTIHLVSDHYFEKLAYSYAFAQSGKLSIFEDKVEDCIESARLIPETLAKTGKVQGNRNDISKRIAQLFINRFYINLNSDILDTPDIFWEYDEFSDHYSSCRGYLELPKRVDILNQRLDIMKDLYNLLNEELTNDHATKLEWIVIWLIAAEVVIEVIAICYGKFY